MITNLTQDKLSMVKLYSKIVAIVKSDRVYVLAVGQKNGTMFVPLNYGGDYRYKGKNAELSVKSALQNDENVIVCDTYQELFRHCA